MDFVSSVTEAFRQDGIWMWSIFVAQVASLVIISERVVALYFRKKPTQKLLAYDFEDDVKNIQEEYDE